MGHLARKKSAGKLKNIAERLILFKDWYKITFPLNRVYHGVQKLHLRNGKFAYVRDVRSTDYTIVRDVLGKNEYELDYLSLPENATVLDLGGNIGAFSMEIHRQFPTARIIAYEPHPANAKMFRMNAPYATLVDKAVSRSTGTIRFEDGVDFAGLKIAEEGGIAVESISLDDIVRGLERVDLLKMDIEGSEYEVLAAASPETFIKIKRILLETHDRPGFDDLAWAEHILSAHDFRTKWIDPQGVVYGEKVP